MESSRRAFVRVVVAGAASIVLGRTASSGSAEVKGVLVGHLWSPDIANDGIRVFGPIFNMTKASDWLVAARSPAAETARFENAAGGKTHAVDRIEIPPGKPVSLAPWSEYIRLGGIRDAAIRDGAFKLTLAFQTAGEIEVSSLFESHPGG